MKNNAPEKVPVSSLNVWNYPVQMIFANVTIFFGNRLRINTFDYILL